MCACVCWGGVAALRTRRISSMTDAAARILSAISTARGSSLSPPVFGCHGDDVRLHHRFSPVDGLRGGATNPGHPIAGTIFPWISAAQVTIYYSTTLVSIRPKCAKLCICKPVSAETRSEPRYSSDLFFFSLSLLGFCALVRLLQASWLGGGVALRGAT